MVLLTDLITGISMEENALNLKYYAYSEIINSYSNKGTELL